MASRIYARTMRQAVSDDTRRAGGSGGDSSDGPGPPPRSGQNESRGTAPTMTHHSTLVDRQVARRSRSRSKTKRIHQLTLLAVVLVLALIGAIMGWIQAWTQGQSLESEALQLDSQLRRAQQELEAARAALQEREVAMLALVEERIPGLTEIQYNTLVEVNDRYLVNFTISEAGTDQNRTLEYHALLKNETPNVVLPAITIYLFDEHGIQVGKSTVDRRHATSPADFAELGPGEARSYHSTLAVERDKQPKYYLLHIE
jgi:hypothetical protein